MASKYEKQAECYENAAAQDARCRAAEAEEKKKKKRNRLRSRPKNKKKSETSCKVHRDKLKDDEDIPEMGATNATFYPVYQQVMSPLGIEFITCMKEEKDLSLYEQFVNKAIKHVSAVDTFVRDVAAQEVLQAIKDRTCKYITEDDDESDDDSNDDVVGPVDIIRTFDRAELTKDIRDTISRCSAA